MKVKEYLCVGLSASRIHCIKRSPNWSSCWVHSQFQKDSCYAGACHGISAICSEGSLRSVGKTLWYSSLCSCFIKTSKFFYDRIMWTCILKLSVFFPEDEIFPYFFFLLRIVKKFVVIYELVFKCLLHAVAHCVGLKCYWCLLKTHPVIAAACWSFRFKWWWSGSREAFM